MKEVDLLVVGGGSAGMSAAVAACEGGVGSILIAERSADLGGILRQCIHNGFGLRNFNADLTGTEYAQRCADRVRRLGIPVLTNAFVIGLTRDRVATVVSPQNGLEKIRAKSVILAMGCRERSRGALLIPGQRPAGVLTAGTAQRYLNLEGYLPGRKIVILGSGDIGLIMARQFVLEGARVQEVVELRSFSGGLPRNIAQCLDDFQIPLSLNTTVVNIHGRSRVEGVTVAQVDASRRPVPDTERFIECDTLLISAGLIPENELTRQAGIPLSPSTGGALVDDCLMTQTDGIFSCGNVLHVHDLVDNVSDEAAAAGRNAALYLSGRLPEASRQSLVPVEAGKGITAVTPQRLRRMGPSDRVILSFRSGDVHLNAKVTAKDGDHIVASRRYAVLVPGEMQNIAIPRSALSAAANRLILSLEV